MGPANNDRRHSLAETELGQPDCKREGDSEAKKQSRRRYIYNTASTVVLEYTYCARRGRQRGGERRALVQTIGFDACACASHHRRLSVYEGQFAVAQA